MSTALRWIPPEQPGPTIILTPRQADVLTRLHQGKSTKQIARELGLSPDTIKSHVRGLFLAAGVRDRAHLVALTCGRPVVVSVPWRWTA